jgi:hypothetical protein
MAEDPRYLAELIYNALGGRWNSASSRSFSVHRQRGTLRTFQHNESSFSY